MIAGLTEGAQVEIFCHHDPDTYVIESFVFVTDRDGKSTWWARGGDETTWAAINRNGLGIERLRHQFSCPGCSLRPEARADQLAEILKPYISTEGVSRVPLVLLDRMLSP